MNRLPRRSLKLSANQRALLKTLLREEGITDSSLPAITRRQDTTALPLSFAQQRLWFLDQLEPDSPVYNITRSFSLVGSLRLVALERSLREIARRHEALRTIFPVIDGRAAQVILPDLPAPILAVIDLAGLDQTIREARLQQMAEEEARRPFDLSRGPLLRVQLLRESATEHVLFLSVHHIVCDGWSLDLLIREISTLYQAYAQDQPSPLPELPIQYADYTLWQRAWLQGSTLTDQLTYWQEHLRGAPATLELAMKQSRPGEHSSQGARYTHELSRELADALASLSQREHATLFMTLLAAFSTLLARYSGQNDLVIGVPIANRTRAEIKDLIGNFANTLALRLNLSGAPRFQSLLAKVREICLAGYAHQDLPFEFLVEALEPERSLHHTPLFQVMFAFQSDQPQEPHLSGLTVSSVLPGHSATARTNLMLTVVSTIGGLHLDFEYRTDLFDASAIARMAAHLQQLLESIVSHPWRSLADLTVLTSTEQQSLLDWNATQQLYDQNQCLHQRFEAQAEQYPARVALVYQDEQLTYSELNRRANRLAHYLRGLGVRPEKPVGLCLERDPELIVALLAILKTGGAYISLDPRYPSERLAFMLNDAGAACLIIRRAWQDRLALPPSVPTVYLDELAEQLDQESEANLENHALSANLAYVIYTSGSTGRPKGVAITHRSTLALLAWAECEFPTTLLTGVLASTSLNFDLSIFELFLPLCSGGSVILARDALQLPELPAAQGVTLLNTVPSVLTALLETGHLPASVRVVTLAGEPLSATLVRRLYALGTVQRIYNLYGPTEDTTYSTWALLPPDPGGSVPIGRPIANTRTYLLDEFLAPVPIGSVGELYLTGEGLARGYLHQPALTAERFLPNPFNDQPGARLYRTGDLACYQADGSLQFVGRRDHQVKLRGYRIELGEIETLLGQHPDVREAVVLLREARPGEPRLVGYLVPQTVGSEPSHEQVRAFLAERLPDYMLPVSYVMLKSLPLSVNGKVERGALPAPEETGQEKQRDEPGERNVWEEMVAGVWEQVLGVKQVGPWDNFFEIGGHSLLATQVIARLSRMVQRELPLRALFETPTVAGLASRLADMRPDQARRLVPPPRPQSRPAELPLAFAQQRLWFLNQLAPATPTYNLPLAMRLSGPLQVKALSKGLSEVARRHEALRTTFPIHNNAPVQSIHPPLSPGLPVVDLGTLPQAQQERIVRRIVSEETLRPFDLAGGPLLRASLLRLADNEHVLVLNLHHIIADGWSQEVLVRELSALYRAYVHARVSPLPDLPLQYADYTLWQRAWLQGEILQSHLDYWQQQLAGTPTVLELPTDRPRPAVQTFRGAQSTFLVPQELTEGLKTLSRQEGVTLFMTLLAGFALLLSRYSGQEDVLIGTPIANRPYADLEQLIGFFVNTLVLRADLAGNPSVTTFLGRVREMALNAYAHQDLPFEKLVETLAPERALSHSSLFQVMFALQHTAKPLLALGNVELQSLNIDGLTAKFALTLSMRESKQELAGVLEYSTDLFDASTIERMATHFLQVLQEMVADPSRRLRKISLLTERERQLMLVDWNATWRPLPVARLVHQLFEEQVERSPDALALQYAQQVLTYSELNLRANQLAHRLRGHGIGPEALVGVSLPRGFDLVIALLAILKAGGAYVPLDPAYPPERLAFMLQDSQARLLITTIAQQISALFMEQDIPCIYLDVDVLETESQENLASVADSQHAAYVIYTSGSTGQPKGTQITQRSLLNLIFWHQMTFGVTARDRATHLAGLSFDAATWELWPYLISGACVCLLDEQTRLAPLALADWLTGQDITISFLPTPLAEQVLTTNWPEFTRLRFLLVGGDRLHFRPSTPLPFTLVNNYGPTEYTVVATSGEVSATITDRLPDIGRPIANTRTYLLDEFLAPVPIGSVGELYLTGEGLARGYLHQPALTAERFLPNPFNDQPGARLYRTGDLACYQADGSLQFVGRRDHQVKLRGYRIELGEIETLLGQHPDVREAVVLLREARPGEPRLVGYLVPQTVGSEPSHEQVRAFLAERLPDYMLPVSYVMLKSLPLSVNGKVERGALPAPEETGQEKQRDEPGERNVWEEMVAGVWEQVLGVKQVGPRDNFFEIGGHSLLATQVIARLSRMVQRELPLKMFFEAPTVAELAHHLNQAYQSEPARSIAAPGRQPRPTDLPLSFAQQRLWFLDQMEPGSSFYNLSVSLRLEGPLRVAALERSLNTIAARHEALRTSFRVINGEPVQLISAELCVPLTIVALEHIPVSQQAAEVRRLAREEFLLPFDLAAGHLMRVHLLRLGADEHLLLLSLHHIVCDGWSMQVLMHELTTLYRAYTREQAPALPELPLQYADYTLWQRAWLQGEILQSHLDYWQQQLAGTPTILELPTDRPRPAVQTFSGAFQRLTLSQELTERLKALSRQEGVTLFMTMLAAFAMLLSRYSGQKDLLIGSPIANRQYAQLERLIGCFANTLVLRADLSGSPTFRELLGRVREMALEAYTHQDLPFERLVEALEPERSLSHSPLFQVIFALQNATDVAPDLADLNVELLAVENRASKYDLGLSLQETPAGLAGVFEYNIDLFDAATIERMGDHLRQLLEGMVANPDQPLETLPWLTERERQQILGEWNQTQEAYPQEGSFSLLFEQQAQRTPDAVALVFEEEHLTYQELNERANQLARLLRKRGVQAETLVGIALERSPDLVVAVLAIFKAGAAYVPLDPGYPAKRLTFMLNDTRAPVVLTQTHLLERLPITEDQAICLDRDWSLCATEARSDLPHEAGMESLAYMIYTSGSTGRPKGVLVPHRGVCNLAEVQRHLFAIQPGERVLQFASLSFDASLWEIIMALYVGATLCLATRETLLPGSSLVRLLQEQAITAVTLPPSALSILPTLAFPALRIILTTGEACTSELVETWASDYRFFNGYGPTEVTICTTVFECQKNGRKPPPIGCPIANLQTYVLDASMQPVPVGIPGELYIGGDALTRGYHRRPELTAERFVPHPFSTRPGQRLYRTGDLVRYLPDGLLEFVGRADTQVKLRGYRIELREIELTLRQHPDAREAVVIMQENLPGGKRLVAYVVGVDQHTPPSVNELRHHLQERLPDYMVPAALLVLERLPLNANGKIDRRLLPAPEELRPEVESHYQAPQTPTEQVITAVWQEVLRLDRIGMDDNFFDLGGHSLLIVQVQGRLRDALKRDLTIVDLFKYPTIGSLARYIGQSQSDQAPPPPDEEWAEKLKAGRDRLKQLRARTGRGVQREKEF